MMTIHNCCAIDLSENKSLYLLVFENREVGIYNEINSRNPKMKMLYQFVFDSEYNLPKNLLPANRKKPPDATLERNAKEAEFKRDHVNLTKTLTLKSKQPELQSKET